MLSSYRVHRLHAIGDMVFIKIARKRCAGYSITKNLLAGKSGVEFGGPSSIFSSNNLVPIYDVVHAIDSCNFSEQTLWTRSKADARFGRHFGKQFIIDACDASGIADESYEFVAASHMLEHVANPLRALTEWRRILKTSGTILLVLPHRAGTFDHRRPFTTFDHVKADFESEVPESDLTHLDEILALHDLELDPAAGSAEQFRNRCLQNASNRAMHHHVFDPELLVEMFTFSDMRVVNVAVARPYHIIVHAQKAEAAQHGVVRFENSAFLSLDAAWRQYDPFSTRQ